MLSTASFLDGFQIFFMVAILPALRKEFDLSKKELTMLTSCQFVGMFVSYIIYAKWADSIGRKTLLLVGLF